MGGGFSSLFRHMDAHRHIHTHTHVSIHTYTQADGHTHNIMRTDLHSDDDGVGHDGADVGLVALCLQDEDDDGEEGAG